MIDKEELKQALAEIEAEKQQALLTELAQELGKLKRAMKHKPTNQEVDPALQNIKRLQNLLGVTDLDVEPPTIPGLK